MVSSNRKIIVSLLLLLSAIVSANAQPAVDKASRATISGKVTIGGKGVSGVVVGLAIAKHYSSTHITRYRGVTDEEGNYRIKNLPPDTYQVLVSAPAYVQSERKSVVVGKNEVVENVDLTLNRGGVITGRVTDADGRPLVEEAIFLSSTTPIRGLPSMRTFLTDDRGIYRAYGLSPGRYTVFAGSNSNSSFGRNEGGLQGRYHPSALTAADATAIEVNEGTEATNVDITLGRELSRYAARGRIIDSDTSQPVPNARIGIQFFFSANGSTSRTATVSTKDGEFEIETLPPGKYGVYLESQTDSEWFSEAVRFEVIDQDVDGLLIKTSKGGSISGVAVLEGAHEPTINLAGHTIATFLSERHNLRSFPQANINQDGSFRFTGLPAGNLTLVLPQNRDRLRVVRIERDGVVYRRDIELKEREQITGLRVVLSQANGKIRGVLKLPEGMTLSVAARLQIYARRIEDRTDSSSPVQVDARGQFLIQDLVPGTYEFAVIVVDGPGDQRPRIPRPAETVMVTNGAIADVTITLQLPKTGPGGP